MTALYIILAIVLFFALILSLRAKVFITQTDTLRLRFGVGPVILTLIPQKRKNVKISDFTYKKHKKRLLAEKKKAARKAEKAKKNKKHDKLSGEIKKAEEQSGGSAGDKLSAVLEIVKFIFEEFPRLASYLKTEIRLLKISVGGDDAAGIAEKYGAVCALTSCLIELIDNKTSLKRMREDSVSVTADFLSEKTVIMIDISLKISIFSILRVGFHTLKWFISQKISKK